MTIENLFTHPLVNPRPEMIPEGLSMQIPMHQRTRNHSGGSTGSRSSSGSTSSFGSDKSLPVISPELLAYHLSQVQLGSLPSRPQGQKQRTERMSTSSDRSAASTNSNGHKNVNPTRYKTEMCRPFEESGHCKYGDKCQFAHGRHELRNLSRHPKYKTELCRTYHTVGFCPYGPRCHFVHNEDDLKLVEINQMKHQQVMKQVAQQVAQQHAQQLSKLSYPQQRLADAVKPVTFVAPVPSRSCQVSRPKTLDFNSLSLPMSPGSTFDSPPSSVSDGSSPSLSPTSMMSDDVFGTVPTPPPGFSALAAHQAPCNIFSFQELSAQSTTAQVSTTSQAAAPVTSLAAGLQATVLNSKSNADMFVSPPTPPLSVDSDDSWASDCLDSGKGLRLPIFNMLATFNEIN